MSKRLQILITEIIGRSEQGITRPFLCRGDDDSLYYVKGKHAGRKALCCEWVAGRLGRILGLPFPPFFIGEVPEPLIRDNTRDDIAELGAGMVFASQAIEDAQELSFAEVGRLDAILKGKVLLFDWWVHNEDRCLTQFGGNPNLLQSLEDGSLKVFDMNLAFDDDFNIDSFWQGHVFNGAVVHWTEDFKTEMAGLMRTGLVALDNIWKELPESWLHQDGDTNLPEELPYSMVRDLLEQYDKHPDAFWITNR